MTGSERAMVGQRGHRVATSGDLEAVRIWLLGGFRISVGSSRSLGEDEWHLRKAGNLVKLLALAPGHRLHREQATGLLWPELDSQAAANNLYHALHIARRTLEPSTQAAASNYLHLRNERLVLCPEGQLWVDVEAFEEAANMARHALEAAAYRAALELYAGELLPQDRYEPWVEQRRAELRALYLALLVELAGLYEEGKEYGPAIEALSTVVAEEPTHEGAHVGLMRLYALSGQRREALKQYERLREALLKEFGSQPEAAARYLQQEIWEGTFPPTHSPTPAGILTRELPSPAEVARHNLPIARTSFVGRERETHEVRRLLAMTGLLTLTGAGGCGKTRLALEAAEEACSGEDIERDDVLDLLSRLVDKSLVVAEAPPGAGGELRYRMLEPIRQYGEERLEESGEAERVRGRHAQYYLARAEADTEVAEPSYLREAQSAASLERMEGEHANLRAALSWSLDKDAEIGGQRAELGLRLAVAMYWFWQTHDYLTEGRRWLEMAVSRRSSDPTTTRLRARALNGAAWIALHQGDYGASKALMEKSMALHREVGDKEGIAAGLTNLGMVAVLGQRDDIPLPAVLEELAELKPGLKNRNSLASLLILEGLIALSRGDLERSAALHEESLELCRETRDTQAMIVCLGNLGTIALVRADYEGAVSPLRESLRLGWETDYKVTIQFSLNGLAYVAAGLEQPLRAARLWGAAESGPFRALVTRWEEARVPA